jgi:uroporphyrinogen decarboxylase
MCHTPELACEVTLQPIEQFGFDAAILFSDILVTLPPMGLEVTFPEKGPVIASPVRDRAAVDRLVVPDPVEKLGYVMEAVRQIRRGLGATTPLIGFAGAPFTLVTYAVEGGGSKDYVQTKKMLFGDAAAAHARIWRRRSRRARRRCSCSTAGPASCRRATSRNTRCAGRAT